MTDDTKLPALPEAKRYDVTWDHKQQAWHRDPLYTAAQMHAYASQAVAAVAEDAGRYRWLIDYDGEDASPASQAAWDAFCGPYVKDYIDAAIDAAMKEDDHAR